TMPSAWCNCAKRPLNTIGLTLSFWRAHRSQDWPGRSKTAFLYPSSMGCPALCATHKAWQSWRLTALARAALLHHQSNRIKAYPMHCRGCLPETGGNHDYVIKDRAARSLYVEIARIAPMRTKSVDKDVSNSVNTKRKGRELSVGDITSRLYSAILEHRIPPGTKLGEDRLAAIFSVNRARIREVLAKLAHERVVDLIPQKGAFVAKPTVEEARDVFEARQLIEPFAVRKLVATLDKAKIAQLREHLELEDQARLQQDQPSIIRLSGEFHILLAELAGNSSLLRSTRELATLTCLIISLYDAP